MIIFLDLDGVFHNFDKAICSELKLDYESRKLRNGAKDDYDYIEKTVTKEVYDSTVTRLGTNFWESLEILPWANTLYNVCVDTAGKNNVFFCSSFGKFYAGASVKAVRVKAEYDTDNIVLTRHKHLLAAPGRILIDDKPANISKFEDFGGTGILWPSQYFFFDGEFDIELWIEKLISKLYGFSQAQIN